MRVDLNAEEVHWLRWALLMTIADLSQSAQTRAILQGILERLEENNREGDRRE